jgi:hypothetical protein
LKKVEAILGQKVDGVKEQKKAFRKELKTLGQLDLFN